ncbi:TPA: Dyp-type peroxidase [Klebsiella oxytoca]|uniref:Dyp-type peroxidase n=1 Tax=Klebsiella oxytoca TaxID=571 RepID=A0AAN5L4K9_KLEOX|nr:Dyp-type peroxidase [Klebsiella oxytoca]MCW9635678.1 Dyp-type peroxidase [Klebsiella oxytoca]CAE7068583.1 putative deferrochelatase/peroxidase YfeX [Klebsiella oxytoca]CAH3701283.1 putative deferrochelatase/peroxidase YfeX [Klebsiella oxytoca]SAQ24937.1 iron-dependent peroxidase [Klebsiella oxytoca]HAT1679707.1 Dyp-type peroxidase [Klebsiella oxytoca]
MSQVQSGILPEHCRAAIWIEANVKGDVDALREASRVFADKLATFQTKYPEAKLGAVVAFGHHVWRHLSGGLGAEELKAFPGYGKGLAPSTQYDVLIHILSAQHELNFSVAQAAMSAFGAAIEVKEEIHGFRWIEERDLSGFVDGTENPAGEETRREVAVIQDGVDAGGSYVFVQRWEHNLKQLNRMSVPDQEMMIGRTKEANEEIDGDARPETSHLSRVDLKEEGKGLKIVRQSLPYGTASGTHGLYFCAYCARLHNIEQQLLSMFGDTDGKRDAMLRFTKPVTGGYYFAPSLDRLLAL